MPKCFFTAVLLISATMPSFQQPWFRNQTQQFRNVKQMIQQPWSHHPDHAQLGLFWSITTIYALLGNKQIYKTQFHVKLTPPATRKFTLTATFTHSGLPGSQRPFPPTFTVLAQTHMSAQTLIPKP